MFHKIKNKRISVHTVLCTIKAPSGEIRLVGTVYISIVYKGPLIVYFAKHNQVSLLLVPSTMFHLPSSISIKFDDYTFSNY